MDILNELFPIHRSLLGKGTKKTLDIIKSELPDLQIKSVFSGTHVFDWTVPQEWVVKKATIQSLKGEILLDISWNILHLLQYSTSIDKQITTNELEKNIHFLKEQPDVIPYVTSYYKKNWGFAMEYNRWKHIKHNHTNVIINITTKFYNGYLNYGELNTDPYPGGSCPEGLDVCKKTVLLSTYICHPNLANDNLSGIVVTIELAKWLLQNRKALKYNYRILFLPETIGSVTYLATNDYSDIIGGYVVSCVGKGDVYTYIKTPNNSITNKITECVFNQLDNKNIIDFHNGCGSDERNYNWPGIDLNIGSITRDKHSSYPEYHTSADDLSLISKKTLIESINIYKKCVDLFETNCVYTNTKLCEPHMNKYDLYPTTSTAGSNANKDRYNTRVMMNVMRYCDGEHDIIDISRILDINISHVLCIVQILIKKVLLVKK